MSTQTRRLSEPDQAPSTSAEPIALAIRHHAEAMDRVGEALASVAGEIRAATLQRRPVDDFYAGATQRLDLVCRWLRVRGPWLLAMTPVVLVAVQAISPEAGKALSALLTGLSR